MSALTDAQRECLLAIYHVFCRDGTWPLTRDLQRRLGRKGIDVRTTLDGLPPQHATYWGSDGKAELMARGLYAVVPDAQELQDLVSLVRLAFERFDPDVEQERPLTRRDLLDLGMDAGRARRCYLLLEREAFVLGAGTATPDGDWTREVSAEIWRFKGVATVDGYFQREAEIRASLSKPPAPSGRFPNATDDLSFAQTVPGGERNVVAPDFSRITKDLVLRDVLSARWLEAQRCFAAGAYLSAIVMIGSVLEGALATFAKAHADAAVRSSAAPRDKTGKTLPISSWRLAQLIDVAHERRWIERDVKDFSSVLRDYRNLVHPAEQARQAFHPDRDTCAILWPTIVAALNDLRAEAER